MSDSQYSVLLPQHCVGWSGVFPPGVTPWSLTLLSPSQHAGARAGDKYPHYLRAKYLGAQCRLYRDVFILVSVDIDITGEFSMGGFQSF